MPKPTMSMKTVKKMTRSGDMRYADSEGKVTLAVFAIEPCHFTRRLAIVARFFKSWRLSVCFLALGDADLGFDSAVLPIKLQDGKGAAGDVRQAVDLVDLASMEQELPDALRRRHFVAGLRVGLNIAAVEKCLALLDPRERVADVGFAGAIDLTSLPLSSTPASKRSRMWKSRKALRLRIVSAGMGSATPHAKRARLSQAWRAPLRR